MKNICLICCSILILNTSVAQQQRTFRGLVCDADSIVIPGALVLLKSIPDSTVLKSTCTDINGQFIVTAHVPLSSIIQISFLGYETISKQCDIEDMGWLILPFSAVAASEVVVTPEIMEEFADRKSYRPDMNTIKNYNSFLESLNTIPMLQVDMNRKLSFMGGGKVKILLNGVSADETDLITLDAADVARIEVYETPPARFADMGLGAVVNIITKQNIKGGSVSINLQDSPYPLYGNNTLGFNYNLDNSRFNFKYNNTLRRDKHVISNEDLRYTFDGTEYEKTKVGIDSPLNWDLNGFQLGYMNRKADKYQFNVTTNFEINDRTDDFKQEVTTKNNLMYDANNYKSNKYKKYAVDLYFNRTIDTKNDLLLNVTGTYFDSHVNTAYIETKNYEDIFSSYSDITASKYSIIADVQYTHTFKAGLLSVGVRDVFENNSQQLTTDNTDNIKSVANNLYGYVGFTGAVKKKFKYSINVGITSSSFNTAELDNSYAFLYFVPKVRLSYNISDKAQLYFTYQWSATNPSISMLSETPILLDTKYAFQGNVSLKPYRTHTFLLGAYYGNKKISAGINLNYDLSHGAFMPYFTENDKYVLQTYANMSRTDKYGVVAQVSWYPFEKQLLLLKVTGAFDRYQVEGPDFSWAHNSMRVIAQVGVNVKKWNCNLFYQTPSKIINGQILRNLPAAAFVEVNFRPIKGMSAGLRWSYPFFDYSEGSQTHESALVSSTSTMITKDYRNMIYVNFVYNFSFGKNVKDVNKRLNNADNDSGILSR